MRAFLSHSSKDKALVDSVAKELGRQYCVYDRYEFKTGDDFRSAIRAGLDRSSVFVLFASQESLESTWVDFEQNEAELAHIQGKIKHPMVFVIDKSVSHSDVPVWLRRGKVTTLSSPRAIAREIRFRVEEMIREQQQPLFVGRHSELKEAEERLLAVDDQTRVPGLLIWGLSGIGRRSLARKISGDYLSLPKNVVIRVQEGDGLPEIGAKIAEHIEVYNDVLGLKKIVDEIELLGEAALLERIVADCSELISIGDLPVLLDSGGLIDNEGNLSDAATKIWGAFAASEVVYTIYISTRRPSPENSAKIPYVRVNPLETAEVSRLVGKIAGAKIRLLKRQIDELAEYVRGYPPAAHFAMEMVKGYGIESVLANKNALVEFRASHFVALLNKTAQLNVERRKILGILSYYSPLPLSVLGSALGLSAERLQEELSYLIDTALVYPELSGLYRLADPVVDAVHRVIDRSEVNHTQVARALGDYIEAIQEQGDVADDEEVEERAQMDLLELSRSLFRARRMAGIDADEEKEISLISDLVTLTVDFYHSRDYDKAIAFGLEAVERKPNSVEARSYLVRALAQSGSYEEAKRHIDVLRDQGILRDAYFLEGFVARLQEHLTQAIASYEEALRRGRRGLAIHRELANCYFHTGSFDKAREHIDVAQGIEPDNRYTVDLQVVIAIKQRDEDVARSKLKILEVVDSEEFYNHRKSTLEYAFGDPEAAYASSSLAATQTSRPTFAMLAQLVKSEIKTKRLEDAAKHLREIDERFGRVRRDIKIGMKCRWEIASGKFRNALGLWSQIVDKDKPIHKALRRDAIEGVLASEPSLAEAERKALEQERDTLRSELITLDFDELDVELDR